MTGLGCCRQSDFHDAQYPCTALHPSLTHYHNGTLVDRCKPRYSGRRKSILWDVSGLILHFDVPPPPSLQYHPHVAQIAPAQLHFQIHCFRLGDSSPRHSHCGGHKILWKYSSVLTAKSALDYNRVPGFRCFRCSPAWGRRRSILQRPHTTDGGDSKRLHGSRNPHWGLSNCEHFHVSV